MKTKKFIRGFAAVMLFTLSFTACSGEADIISYETGEGTQAPEESPAIAAKDIHAALLIPDNPDSGACMSAAHAAAFEAAATELGISSVTLRKALPETADNLTKRSNVIFASSYDYMNVLDECAKNNPDKLYACFGGYKYNSTNYTNFYTAIYEAQYLAGVAAGTNTKTGKIGIISEYSAEYPDSAAEINSFAIGAKAANSEAEILVHTLGSRTDTANAEEFTKDLISKGCDVISIQCDTSVPAKIASDKGIKFIGYGIDMSSVGDGCLTSVVWNLKDYYIKALNTAINGTWAAENYYGNLSDGAVSLSPLSEDADIQTQARIDSAAELIRTSKLEVFSNSRVSFDAAGEATVTNAALIDNNSNIMISEDGASYFIYSGEELKAIEATNMTSDKLASANMNYLVDGVTVID